MHIAEVLHDLIEHCPAYTSAGNREDAHQAVDDTYPGHDDHAAGAPAPDPKARVAELEAELEKLREQTDTGA